MNQDFFNNPVAKELISQAFNKIAVPCMLGLGNFVNNMRRDYLMSIDADPALTETQRRKARTKANVMYACAVFVIPGAITAPAAFFIPLARIEDRAGDTSDWDAA